jgi:protein TonB
MVIKNDHPKLAVDPAIMMPKDIQLPNNNLPNLGDPRTSVVGPASNGSGSGAGMGTGSGGGIGSGKGTATVRVKAAATAAVSTMWVAAFLPRN